MQLNKFLEKFLPEYEQKLEEQRDKTHILSNEGIITMVLPELYLPEALQNFADRICEKQRENCLQSCLHGDYLPDYIVNAEQPKIDEL
jgi:hypothetical protein